MRYSKMRYLKKGTSWVFTRPLLRIWWRPIPSNLQATSPSTSLITTWKNTLNMVSWVTKQGISYTNTTFTRLNRSKLTTLFIINRLGKLKRPRSHRRRSKASKRNLRTNWHRKLNLQPRLWKSSHSWLIRRPTVLEQMPIWQLNWGNRYSIKLLKKLKQIKRWKRWTRGKDLAAEARMREVVLASQVKLAMVTALILIERRNTEEATAHLQDLTTKVAPRRSIIECISQLINCFPK